MIEIRIRFDYENFDSFWNSLCGNLITQAILLSKCISWEGLEVHFDAN